MMKGSFLLAALSAFVLAAAVSSGAQTVLHVQTGSSIQAVVDLAAPGTTIELGPGTWQENLEIVKPISIRGAGPGRTKIVSREAGYPVVWISSLQTGSVTIAGLAVTGAYGKTCADNGLEVCADGLLAQGRIELVLTDCLITGNSLHGLYASDEAHLSIARSTFSQNYSGIWLSSSASARIGNTKISQNGFGLVLAGSSSAAVTGCTISGNDRDGVLIADSTDLTLYRSRIVGNGRAGVCVDEWPCYSTERVFTGTVRGKGNIIPTPREKDGNGKTAICPVALRFLSSQSGGIYPIPDPKSLFKSLPIYPPMEGSPDAPVTVIEFSDFTCPYCAQFARDVLPKLRADYIGTGKIKLFFLPYPVHGETAAKEAEAAFCAQEQGRFWEFHDRMFADLRLRGFPRKFDPERVRAIAAAAGCDPDRLSKCLSSGTYTQAVEGSIAIANKLGVTGTPTFFIAGQEIPGAASYEVWS